MVLAVEQTEHVLKTVQYADQMHRLQDVEMDRSINRLNSVMMGIQLILTIVEITV